MCNLAKIRQFHAIFGTQITFDMFCTVKSLKDLKPKARSEFSIYRVLLYPVIMLHCQSMSVNSFMSSGVGRCLN